MIDFAGIDVLIAHSIPEEALKGALSEVLKVPASRIAVIHSSVEDYPETHAADVVCVVSPAGGDFDQLLPGCKERPGIEPWRIGVALSC